MRLHILLQCIFPWKIWKLWHLPCNNCHIFLHAVQWFDRKCSEMNSNKKPNEAIVFSFLFFLTKLDTWMISSNNITSIIFCMVYYSTKVFSFFFHTCTIIRYIYLFHQVLQIYKFGNTWHEALFTKRIIIIRETHWRYKFIEKYCLFQFHYCYVVIMLNAWVIVLAIFMMYCYFCNIISFLRTFNFCSTGRK